jgi:hypothetical protein
VQADFQDAQTASYQSARQWHRLRRFGRRHSCDDGREADDVTDVQVVEVTARANGTSKYIPADKVLEIPQCFAQGVREPIVRVQPMPGKV